MRWLLALLLAGPAAAETVVATRTIRPMALIQPGDVAVIAGRTPGALDDPALAIGREARVALYAGRPVRPEDVGPAALVERNQPVTLVFEAGALAIRTEGRALGRGALGETIRVMNTASRSIVSGRVTAPGTVAVENPS